MSKMLSSLIVTFLFLADYIVLSLKLPSLLGAWREILVLTYVSLLLSWTFVCIAARKAVDRKHCLQLNMFFFAIAFYLICGDFSEPSFRIYRSFVMPVLLGLLVAVVAVPYDLRSKLGSIYTTLLVMTTVTGLYAIYQYVTIEKAESFWYWPLLTEKGFELQPYNSMRNNMPRMSGFFTGTLEFSAVVLNTTILLLALLFRFLRQRAFNLKFFIFLILTCFFIGLLFYGSVRTALIGLVTCGFYLIALRYIASTTSVIFVGYLYVATFTSSIFLYLVLGYTEDLSALDRVRQWIWVIDLLNDNPLGLGFSSVGPGQKYWFDSFWLNLLASSGYIGVGILVGMLFFYRWLVIAANKLRSSDSILLNATADYLIVSYPFFLSSFFFQAYTNSAVLYLFVILVMVVMYESKFNYSKD